MKLNKDIKRRDELIFGKYSPEGYLGGIKRFGGLTLDKLETLLKEKFADPDEAQNASPTIAEFRDFLLDYPSYTAHGYAVSDDRSDYRVTIEGVGKTGGYDSAEELEAFISMFRCADEFMADRDGMFCWYD